MAKYFEQISPKDADTLEWRGKDGKVTVNIALDADGKWRPCMKSKGNRFFIVRSEEEKK